MLLLLCLIITFSPAAPADDGAEQLRAASAAAAAGDHRQAVEKLDALLKEHPEISFAWYLRGRENFLSGRVKESLSDFDRHLELSPQLASRQWERGLTLYYAGKYADGAKQFELYQNYHDQDVENSVWRYLCSAKTEGVEKARSNMLPIERDPRVPLMEVFDLYRGEKSVDDVFTAARAGKPGQRELKTRLFYANLYVGLWYDSLDQPDQALRYLQPAAKDADAVEYMGEVAKLHVERLQAAAAKTPDTRKPDTKKPAP